MPNHIHGIIEISKSAEHLDYNTFDYTDINIGNSQSILRSKNISPLPKGTSKTIGAFVRGFKIGVTKWVRQSTAITDVWQRSFYEHIIRNQKSHQNIADYIKENPLKWANDKFYIKS